MEYSEGDKVSHITDKRFNSLFMEILEDKGDGNYLCQYTHYLTKTLESDIFKGEDLRLEKRASDDITWG